MHDQLLVYRHAPYFLTAAAFALLIVSLVYLFMLFQESIKPYVILDTTGVTLNTIFKTTIPWHIISSIDITHEEYEKASSLTTSLRKDQWSDFCTITYTSYSKEGPCKVKINLHNLALSEPEFWAFIKTFYHGSLIDHRPERRIQNGKSN